MHKLFIVEDEAIIAMDLAEQLEELGYQVVGIAHDGESALDQLTQLDPDLILMDIVLGSGMDGIDVSEQILQTRNLPIIFLTAFSDPETVGRAAKTTPYGYITKPYKLPELQATIEIALAKHNLEHKLLYNERWFSNILHAVNDAIIAVGTDGLIHFVNEEALRLLGEDQTTSLLGLPAETAICLYDRNGDRAVPSPVTIAMQQNCVIPVTFGGSVKDPLQGQRTFVDYAAAPVRGKGNIVVGGILALRDASRRLAMEQSLKSSPDQYNLAFSNTSVGVALVSFSHDLIHWNQAFSDLFLLDNSDSSKNLLTDVLTNPAEKEALREGLLPLFSGLSPDLRQDLLIQRGGQTLNLKLVITLLHDDQMHPAYYLYQCFNETDRLQAERQLNHVLHYDLLTGLIGPVQIEQEVIRQLEMCRQEELMLAVAILDIDQFRRINDRYSLEVGDDLLCQLAQRFTDIEQFNLTIGRSGGDRFTLMMHSLESVNQAMYTVSQVQEELNEPFYIGADTIFLTACAGIAITPDDAEDAANLLQRSEDALKLAKSSGKNQICFFNKAATQEIQRRVKNEARICQAIEHNQLEIHAFPIMDKTRQQTGAALCTYWPEEKNYFCTDSFMRITGFTDLPCLLIQALLKQALQLAESQSLPLILLPCHHASLLGTDKLLELLNQYREKHPHLVRALALEFSEQSLKSSSQSLIQIAAIRRMGFRIGIRHCPDQALSVSFLHRLKPDYYLLSLAPSQAYGFSTDPGYFRAIISALQALKIPLIIAEDANNPDGASELAGHLTSQDQMLLSTANTMDLAQ